MGTHDFPVYAAGPHAFEIGRRLMLTGILDEEGLAVAVTDDAETRNTLLDHMLPDHVISYRDLEAVRRALSNMSCENAVQRIFLLCDPDPKSETVIWFLRHGRPHGVLLIVTKPFHDNYKMGEFDRASPRLFYSLSSGLCKALNGKPLPKNNLPESLGDALDTSPSLYDALVETSSRQLPAGCIVRCLDKHYNFMWMPYGIYCLLNDIN